MGAGLNMIIQRTFDMEGNSWLQYFQPRSQRPLPEGEELEKLEWENDFFNNENDMNILATVSFNENETHFSLPKKIIFDYEEFIKYTDSDIFMVPQYIPDGYQFNHAQITFFIGNNIDINILELLQREEKFGNIYEKYYVPENLENIQSISIGYCVKEENNIETEEETSKDIKDSQKAELASDKKEQTGLKEKEEEKVESSQKQKGSQEKAGKLEEQKGLEEKVDESEEQKGSEEKVEESEEQKSLEENVEDSEEQKDSHEQEKS
jgi:hypothetical protein